MGSNPVRVTTVGGLAQLVRAPASHAGGHWFESSSLHQNLTSSEVRFFLFSAKGKTSCLSREKKKRGNGKTVPSFFSSDSGRLLGGAVKEGNDLRTQAVAVRGEGGVARAGGHTRVDGPLHGGGVEGARAHIGKGVRALSRRCAGRSPLEGDSLCARDGSIRGEGRAARAGGHVVFHRPRNGLFRNTRRSSRR